MPHTNGHPHPDPAIEALKQAVSLVDIVEAAGVKLEGTLPNLRALCPLHPEKTPSFNVTVENNRQLWHCLGCKKGGDVFDFLAAKEGMAFPQALAHLRQLTGQPGPAKAAPQSPRLPPVADKEAALPGGFTRRELLERVVAIYQTRLRDTQEGQAYLKSRHLDVPELWTVFRLGYADGALLNTLGKDSQVQEALKAIGVVTAKDKELFHGCIVVPLEDPVEGVVGLYGRRIRADAHVPHLYLPGPRRGVLNWQALKLSSHVILTESVLDALSVWVAGRRDVTCMYGTNGFTRQLDDLLERFGTQELTFCLDSDVPGQKAARELADRLSTRRIHCASVSLPTKDANAMLCEHGPDALKHALSQPQPLSTGPILPAEGDVFPTDDGFLMQWGGLSYRLTPRPPFTGSRLKATLQAELNGQVYSDSLSDLTSQRVRQSFANHVSRRLGLLRDDVEQHLATMLRETQRWVATQPGTQSECTNPFSAPPPPPMTDEDREQALMLLRRPDLMETIAAHTEALGHVGDDKAKLLVYLVATSRRRAEPLSAIILSQSGTGKSTLSLLIQRLLPPEELVALTRVSPKAFTYLPKDGVKHKTVAMEEGVGASDDAQYAVRVLQTAPVFRSAVTKTDPATGETTTRVYEVEGPIAYIETTTNPRLNHENATRAFEVTLNESEEQTRRIHDLQRKRRSEAHMLETAATYVDPEAICHLHQNAQRLLQPLLVLNRFDTRSETGLESHLSFPSRRTRTRRDHERFMSLVDTVAFLHQYQREHGVLKRPSGPVPYIVATFDDYRIAYDLARSVLGVTLHELSRHGQDLKPLINTMLLAQVEGDVDAVADTLFTRRQLREFTDWEDHRLRETLEELVNLEHLAVAGGGGRGATVRYRLLPDDANYGPGLTGLTTPEELEARMAAARPVSGQFAPGSPPT